MILGRPRGTLFRKYALHFAGLVSMALLASGAMGLYFAYRDTQALVEELQREKARGAAMRIQQFVNTIEGQLKAALITQKGNPSFSLREQHFELIRLLRRAPAVIDAAWVDTTGVRRIKVSRLARDEFGPGEKMSAHPGVSAALAGRTYSSPVYFRQQSEPYLTVATGSGKPETGVILADVNLKFVREVVSAIRIGESGFAYVVDSSGRLIAHPDISLVLSATDLSRHAPVAKLLAGTGSTFDDISISQVSSDGHERRTLTVQAPIPAPGWHVLVEQPLNETFAPLYASAARSGLLLLIGIALAVVVSVVLARRMTAPIRTLQEGAMRLGEGRLQERVRVTTDDELETLADQFNRMAERLHDSYAGLEQKVQERTRQLAAANRAKSRFLAAASHDLRQPAHALGLYVAQLPDAGNPQERSRLIEKIIASSTAVSELLETLLDISKLDLGAVTPQPADFAIQLLFNRLEASYAITAQAKGLRLRVRPSPRRVLTDPLLLERIVMNLVANAVRYTREGGVLVACRRRGDNARIEIWDTGVGIAADQQEHIFEEFYQAHALPDEHGKGLGLGLAIVDRLARLLELRVEFRSVEGRGSMFAVEVPQATGAAAGVPAVSDPQAQMRFDGATAVVLDDDAGARDSAVGLLTQWGWNAIGCASGDEALARLEQSPLPLDAIISDYRLDHGELGTQAIQRIRAAVGREVPAIVVCGDISVDLRETAQDHGLHWLYKPLQAAKLRTLLHHLVHQAENAGRAGAQRDASPADRISELRPS